MDPLSRTAQRPTHPQMPELLGGTVLSVRALTARDDAPALKSLIELISNAEYWIGFDLAPFEPLLSASPSPLRELGVGIALRFSEELEGHLTRRDLDAARAALLPSLPESIRDPVTSGLDCLERALMARDRLETLRADGFEPYQRKTMLSVAALMAMGKANLEINGDLMREREKVIGVGELVRIRATDERGKALDRPELEPETAAPVLSRDEDGAERSFVFLVPGRYRLRVPGRSEGFRQLQIT